jgi:hypothetical protein
MNRYSIVVQEYFQQRVVKWLETVGKSIFRIKHYWIRYEFAPGRGQIHAHLLAIPDDHSIYEYCHLDLQQANGSEKRAQRMSEWAKEYLGLTATVSNDFNELEATDPSPVSVRFTEIEDLPEMRDEDFQKLLKAVQIHECSGFCMRTKKKR